MKWKGLCGICSESAAWRLAVLLLGILYLLTVPRGWQCESSDELEYLGLAHSLSLGEGYLLNGEPYGYYPPLYPALLSIPWRLGHWGLLYALGALAGWSALALLANHIRKTYGVEGRRAAWVMLLSYYAWSFSTRYLMAESFYFLFSAFALVGMDRRARPDGAARWSLIAVPLGVLLAAMTKTSSVALTAAVGMSGLLAWLVRRNRPALVLALVACMLGGAFTLGWEIRAQVVVPDATESYGRWMLKWVGVSAETNSIVARSAGEGISGDASILDRGSLMAEKLGSYVASVVRMPGNFQPVSFCLVFLCGLGWWRLLRMRPESPLGWFMAFTVAMGTMTYWASSYHRYLYPVTPVLFLAVFLGAGEALRCRRWMLLLALFGVWGLVESSRADWGLGDEGNAVGLYRLLTGMLAVAAYLILAVLPVLSDRYRNRPSPRLAPLYLVVVLHFLLLLGDRYRRTLTDEMPRQLNLADAQRCAVWIQHHTPEDARIASSLPRLTAFLTRREAVSPGRSEDYTFLLGPLEGLPAFRPGEETRLRNLVDGNRWVPVFASGGAAVYKVNHDHVQ